MPGSDVTIEDVWLNPTRIGLLPHAARNGRRRHFENEREEGGEPVADIRARFSRLKGVTVPAERAPP